jgi:transcriptional regulator with XRE-family HTH domain
MTVRERILIALERSKKSQRDLAKAMGLSSPTVSSMLAKDEIDSIKYLKAVEELTGFSFEWLRTGSGSEKPETQKSNVEEPPLTYWQDKLKTKDELIEELKGRITDMKKYQELLEKQAKDKKG